MKRIVALTALTLCVSFPAFADGDGVDCHAPENAKLKAAAKGNYETMLASDKAGRFKQAYDAARVVDAYCISKNEQERNRIRTDQAGVLKRSSKKLGEQAESQGKFAEAYDYYIGFHGIDADRAQLKLATARPGDFTAVQQGVGYFHHMQEILGRDDTGTESFGDLDKARLSAMDRILSQDTIDTMDPERKTRLQAVNDHLGKLEAIAIRNGDAALADEEKVFAARKTSATAKMDTLKELGAARDWFGLAQQEKRANDRAVKRGDILSAEDGRNSLRFAMSYYDFAGDEAKTAMVRDKARRLADAHLKKGDKVMAADYYNIAGLNDKAVELGETHEKEKQQAEAKRQDTFKQEQKSLEEELGF